ncbi:MAG: EipA family protein [Aliihoeflea sp.]
MKSHMPAALFQRLSVVVICLAAAMMAFAAPARASQYTAQEIVDSGHQFFGSTSGGLATVVEQIFQSYGLPNGYILGEEAGGAFIGGLTYGEGTLHTKNVGDHRVYWQGPSLGLDAGGQGSRSMILVYNLESVPSLYQRYGGVAGSAYLVAGLGFNVMKAGNTLLVPVRTGVGARLGINVGYLKMTPQPTWNPF